MVVGLALLVVLVLTERTAAHPIMPLRLFASRQRVGAYLTRMLYLGAMIGFFYFTTQYLQSVLGFSAFVAGLAFLLMTVVNFAVAVAIPRLTRRFGQALPLTVGVALTLLGFLWLGLLEPGSGYWTAVAAPMLLIGAGQGLAFAPLTSAGIAGVATSDAGAASGLVNTFHQVGMAVGLGVLVTASAHSGAGLAGPAAVLTAQVGTAFDVGALLLAAALVVVVTLLVPAAGRGYTAVEARPAPKEMMSS